MEINTRRFCAFLWSINNTVIYGNFSVAIAKMPRGGYKWQFFPAVNAVSTQNKKKTFLKKFPKNKKKFT